jgi:hypothetical protein
MKGENLVNNGCAERTTPLQSRLGRVIAGFGDFVNEHFSIADQPSPSGTSERTDDVGCPLGRYNDLQPGFAGRAGAHGGAADADRRQRVVHVAQLVRLDDEFNLLHSLRDGSWYFLKKQ